MGLECDVRRGLRLGRMGAAHRFPEQRAFWVHLDHDNGDFVRRRPLTAPRSHDGEHSGRALHGRLVHDAHAAVMLHDGDVGRCARHSRRPAVRGRAT
jgi:hypothetical protein